MQPFNEQVLKVTQFKNDLNYNKLAKTTKGKVGVLNAQTHDPRTTGKLVSWEPRTAWRRGERGSLLTCINCNISMSNARKIFLAEILLEFCRILRFCITCGDCNVKNFKVSKNFFPVSASLTQGQANAKPKLPICPSCRRMKSRTDQNGPKYCRVRFQRSRIVHSTLCRYPEHKINENLPQFLRFSCSLSFSLFTKYLDFWVEIFYIVVVWLVDLALGQFSWAESL